MGRRSRYVKRLWKAAKPSCTLKEWVRRVAWEPKPLRDTKAITEWAEAKRLSFDIPF